MVFNNKNLINIKFFKSSFFSGFTLIELIFVVFLGLVIMVGILSLYSWHTKVYSFQEATVLASEEARNTGKTLSFYALQSSKILASTTIDSNLYTSSATTVIFQLPVFDSSGNQIPGAFDKVAIYLDGQKLFLKNSLHPSSLRIRMNKLLSNKIQNFNITYDNANFDLVKKIYAILNILYLTNNGTQAIGTFEQSMRLRNY